MVPRPYTHLEEVESELCPALVCPDPSPLPSPLPLNAARGDGVSGGGGGGRGVVGGGVCVVCVLLTSCQPDDPAYVCVPTRRVCLPIPSSLRDSISPAYSEPLLPTTGKGEG